MLLTNERVLVHVLAIDWVNHRAELAANIQRFVLRKFVPMALQGPPSYVFHVCERNALIHPSTIDLRDMDSAAKQVVNHPEASPFVYDCPLLVLDGKAEVWAMNRKRFAALDVPGCLRSVSADFSRGW